jgi:hypothetical protein
VRLKVLAMTYPIGTCPECGAERIWLSREFNPYPRWTYRHKAGCVAGKFFPESEQERQHTESGSCFVHGFSPALDCPGCIEVADYDHGTEAGLD